MYEKFSNSVMRPVFSNRKKLKSGKMFKKFCAQPRTDLNKAKTLIAYIADALSPFVLWQIQQKTHVSATKTFKSVFGNCVF